MAVSDDYDRAALIIRETENRKLTPKEFLDTIDPHGSRSAKSARDYIRRIRKGERSGSIIDRRSEDDAPGTYVATYRDENGEYHSAVITIPKGGNRKSIYSKRTAIDDAVRAYLKKRYAAILAKIRDPEERETMRERFEGVIQDFTGGRLNLRDVKETRHPAQIVRGFNK